MNFLAGVSLLKRKRPESVPSEYDQTNNEATTLRSDETHVNDAVSTLDGTEKSSASPAASTPGRSTRWSSALMNGADPRILYGNKRFNTIYDSWEGLDQKRSRRAKLVIKDYSRGGTSAAARYDKTDISEDEWDNTISEDKDTILAVLKTIADIVTTLVTKIRFAVEERAAVEDPSIKTAYGTRSTAAIHNNQRNSSPYTGSTERTALRKELGVCDDLDTLQNDLQEMLQRSNRIAREKKRNLMAYYMAEYIAMRANYYYRMIRNMQHLEQHSLEYTHVPEKMVSALLDIYRCAALGHLENLRRYIPKKIKRAGVLDFRTWRVAINRVPVTMEYLRSVLTKYDYNRIKDRIVIQQTHVDATPVIHKVVVQPTKQLSPLVGSPAAVAGVTAPIKPKGVSKTQPKQIAITSLYALNGSPKPVISAEHGNNQTSVKAGSIGKVNQTTPARIHNASERQNETNGTKRMGSIDNKNDSNLFNDEESALTDESCITSPQTRGPSYFGVNSRTTTMNSNPGTPKTKKVVSTRRPSLSRRNSLSSGKGSTASAESWRNLRIPQMFERVKRDSECSIKIPKRKQAGEGTSDSEPSTQGADSAGNVPGGKRHATTGEYTQH